MEKGLEQGDIIPSVNGAYRKLCPQDLSSIISQRYNCFYVYIYCDKTTSLTAVIKDSTDAENVTPSISATYHQQYWNTKTMMKN